ncbi:MAG: archaeosortase/exosortase family protein [Dehalococcoidia bacterium]|nr:archaeosortase/exosortase family protein [Dehalococcoidia bacterium]
MIAVAILLAASLCWAVAVRFFWKAGAWLPYFIVGAAGCAILLVFGLRSVVPGELALRHATAASVNAVAWIAGVHTRVSTANPGDLLVVGVPYHNEWTMLSIGIECSGLLETATLAGLVLFFPALPMRRRLIVLAIALGLTFAANIVRMLVIVLAVAYWGQASLDIAHVVFGRAVFFVLAIGIYWFAITRPTLNTVAARLRGAH